MPKKIPEYGAETAAIHAGERPDKAYGAVSVPIYQTSNFVFEDIGKSRGYDYSRSGNPTRAALEATIAKLEGGKAAFAFASGMAAETTIMHMLNAGDHVISGDDIYGGTFRFFSKVMSRFGLEFTFMRLNNRKKIEEAIRPETRLIWFETPSNPLLNIVDLEMIAAIARKHKLISVIDNTFASPYFLRPIDFGIDVIMHSTTKYLNGHCDVVGGAVVTSTDELTENIRFLSNAMGTQESPFDSWLVMRGIETLGVRMRQHEENATAVANFLNGHKAVKKTLYPGLASHPGHNIARAQMKGFGGMISFEIKGGAPAAHRFIRRLKLFSLAESLGGTTSLVEHPYSMSHASMSEEQRRKSGISEGLVRLSIGLENKQDLIVDLNKALG